MQPTHIFHADWGAAPNKRWLARATLDSGGIYIAHAPVPVKNHQDLIHSVQREIGHSGCAVLGFDFAIGIPASYAQMAGVVEFKSFLRALGEGEWAEFYNVARVPLEISVHRPFYPFAPGGKRQRHLVSALGLKVADDLRRKCEKAQAGRRAACPLFWTLGPNQVGKGAIVGWQDVLAPALRDDKRVSLWPFDGCLNDLLLPGRVVIVETYPAECYTWFFPETVKGKGEPEVRKEAGVHLLRWAKTASVELDAELARTIEQGFPEGDDPFDAVVALFGMIEVVTGRRQRGEPTNDKIRTLEGWILGQTSEWL